VEDPSGSRLDADPPLSDDGAGAQKGAAGTDLQRGRTYLEEGKFAEAKDHLEKARAKDPRSAEAAFYLALAQEKLGDKAGAEQSYMDALKLDPKLAEAAGNLTALYLEEPARPDEAIKILKDMLAKVPKDTALMTNLAYAYALKKDVANASKQYDAIIAGGGAGVDVRLAYGQLLLDAKQKEKAAEQFKKGGGGGGQGRADADHAGALAGAGGGVRRLREGVRQGDRAEERSPRVVRAARHLPARAEGRGGGASGL
jgi:Tfp pilus assembly protein PilF